MNKWKKQKEKNDVKILVNGQRSKDVLLLVLTISFLNSITREEPRWKSYSLLNKF